VVRDSGFNREFQASNACLRKGQTTNGTLVKTTSLNIEGTEENESWGALKASFPKKGLGTK
jgi:hypothetical protein